VQAINGLLRGITFSSEMGTGSLEENALKKAMAAAGSSTAERKQKGRREAGLFKSKMLRSGEDQYFATKGPPQR
jgi:hypothetical protein